MSQRQPLYNGNQNKNKKVEDKTKQLKKKSQYTEPEEDDDQDYGDEDDNNDDQWFSDSSCSEEDEDNPKQEREPRLIMYAAFTQYDVVKEVGKTVFNYHLTKNDQKDWDIAWFDGAISLKLLQKMWPHQRTNHFPGMYNLARKNCLGRHLMRMQKWFPQDYDFFPQTFMCPTDYKEFKAQITAKRNKTFIVKPEASCQGKGIFLTRNFEDLDPNEHYVVQRYMHKPYLIDGFKFDLRIYVLLAGVDPLRVYIYKEGLARFATVPYESPTPQNLSNLFMHLTNYAINKDSENFVANNNEKQDDVGSKRSFTSILRKITEEFGQEKCDEVFESMQDLIIKTLCIAQPYLQHLYKGAQPNDLENSLCCQVLGFDIMLDHTLKPQLLEVNQSPSFTTDSPLDYKIKKALITDTIKLWNLSIKRKLRAKGNKRLEMQQRLLKSNKPVNILLGNDKQQPSSQKEQKDEVLSPGLDKNTQIQTSTAVQKPQYPRTVPKSPKQDKKQLKLQMLEEKAQQRKKKMLHREKVEKELQGDYHLMYPKVSYEEEFEILDKIKLKEEEEKGKNKVTEEDDNLHEIGKEYGPAWQKQQMYCLFMEKAKQLWESFTQGKAVDKKRKDQELKEQEEKQKKEQQQKKKTQMWVKFKKQNEERKAKEEEDRRNQYEMMRQYHEQFRQEQSMNASDNQNQYQQLQPVNQIQLDSRYMPLNYLNNNNNHLPYKTPLNAPSAYPNNAGIFSSRNILGSDSNQQRVISQQILEFQPQINNSVKTTLKEKLNPDYPNKNQAESRQYSSGDTKTLGISQNGNNFYLPDVTKATFSIKKQIHDDYNEKTTRFQQLMRFYDKNGVIGQDQDTSLPAVPALTQGNKRKESGSDQISTTSSISNNQKPPLNTSLMQKRLEDSRSQSRLQNKKQSLPANSNQLPSNKRLNELLSLQGNQNYLNQVNANQQINSNFVLSKPQQQAMQANINAQNTTEGKINGINHYQMLPTYELLRSMSLDRKDIPNSVVMGQNSIKNANSSQSKQSTQQLVMVQDQIKENLKSKQNLSQHHNKKQRSEVLSDSSGLISLGVVGERKTLINNQQNGYNCLEGFNTGGVQKKSKLLKIKDHPRQQGPITINGQSVGYISANELYKLTH